AKHRGTWSALDRLVDFFLWRHRDCRGDDVACLCCGTGSKPVCWARNQGEAITAVRISCSVITNAMRFPKIGGMLGNDPSRIEITARGFGPRWLLFAQLVSASRANFHEPSLWGARPGLGNHARRDSQ